MKVADFVAEFVAGLNGPGRTRVYGICGAGAMHLNDALCHRADIDMVPMQHEQAGTYAAEAEARVTGNIGVVSVTAGPGGSNTLTGLACAYVDSIPLMVIAGQVTTHTMVNDTGLRQAGMNELPMVAMATPVTKYAATVTDPADTRYHLEKALALAMAGRKGPVYVEFPLDVQAAEIDPVCLRGFWQSSAGVSSAAFLQYMADNVYRRMDAAKRPVVIVGNGVRLAGACDEFRRMVDELQAPIISSWSAADIIPTDHPCYIGRCGIFGDRASNWVVQNADLILAIGTRLSPAQTGHHSYLFGRDAQKIIVDIDLCEAGKRSIKADLPVIADAKEFLTVFEPRAASSEWLAECRSKMVPESRSSEPGQLTSYKFIDRLSLNLDHDAIVVTDVGFSFIPTMQELRLRGTQRLIHSCGVSPMGWGLPAAIGASLAQPRCQVVCLTGDGGLMLNVQELYTIAQRNLPIAIVVYCNNGYATMRIAQNNHFKRESISGPESGLPISADMLLRIARGFGIKTMEIKSAAALGHFGAVDSMLKSVKLFGAIDSMLGSAKHGPIFVVLRLPENEVITPRVQAAMESDGKFKPVTLEDQWPRLNQGLKSSHPEPAM